jgi:hypothetical protein
MKQYANVQMGLLPLRSLYSLRPLREILNHKGRKDFREGHEGMC